MRIKKNKFSKNKKKKLRNKIQSSNRRMISKIQNKIANKKKKIKSL